MFRTLLCRYAVRFTVPALQASIRRSVALRRFTVAASNALADDVEEMLKLSAVEFRPRGSTLELQRCPFCGEGRRVKWQLLVYADTGSFSCKRCAKKGHWSELRTALGLTVREVSAPDQAVAKQFMSDLPAAVASESIPSLAAFTPEILQKYHVGLRTCKILGEEQQCVTFPWTREARPGEIACDENVKHIRVKSVATADAALALLEPAKGEWGLFGWHTVPKDAPDIVVTASERDAMIVHQVTGMPTVALPAGTQQLPRDVMPQLERFKRVFLWLPDDMRGRDAAQRFARKLGIDRCRIVRTKTLATDPVSPLEAAEHGKDLNALFKQTEVLPHEQLLKFDELRADIEAEFADPQGAAGVECLTLPSLTALLKGHRRGELTVVTGNTGIGKTTFLTQYSVDLCTSGVPTLFGSFEIKNTRVGRVMLTQLAGRSLEGDSDAFNECANQLTAMPMHFMRFFGNADVNAVHEAMQYAVDVHDVAHIVLDNLQFMLGSSGTRGIDKFDAQDAAIARFRRFASDNNVHVTMVIHPRKTGGEALLSTTSVFGTAKATQEADNVIVLQTAKAFKFLDVRKNRFSGNVGVVPLAFDRDSLLFRELQPSAMNEEQMQCLEQLAKWHGLNTDHLQFKPGATKLPAGGGPSLLQDVTDDEAK
eukprot:TRINITY_DN2488_c0_g4_i1.p1 TRINITY_DN2488_c0_g4~~TRINITY_DN2488_c0_g4_i1.p1  ORF type:complete len:652 (+),score=140.36 TRINITY_DN2488_c0_g4_i1:49-2004(+)